MDHKKYILENEKELVEKINRSIISIKGEMFHFHRLSPDELFDLRDVVCQLDEAALNSLLAKKWNAWKRLAAQKFIEAGVDQDEKYYILFSMLNVDKQ